MQLSKFKVFQEQEAAGDIGKKAQTVNGKHF